MAVSARVVISGDGVGHGFGESDEGGWMAVSVMVVILVKVVVMAMVDTLGGE